MLLKKRMQQTAASLYGKIRNVAAVCAPVADFPLKRNDMAVMRWIRLVEAGTSRGSNGGGDVEAQLVRLVTYTAACASATIIVLMSWATSKCVKDAEEAGEILNKHSPVLTTHNLPAVRNAAIMELHMFIPRATCMPHRITPSRAAEKASLILPSPLHRCHWEQTTRHCALHYT